MLDLQREYKELLQLTRTFLEEQPKGLKFPASSPEVASAYRNVKLAKVPKPNLGRSPKVADNFSGSQVKKAAPAKAPTGPAEREVKKAQSTPEEKSEIELEAQKRLYSQWKGPVAQLLPRVRFREAAPEDKEARATQEAWRGKQALAETVILSCDFSQDHRAFLQHLAQALNLYGHPTRLLSAGRLEAQDSWAEIFESSEVHNILLFGEPDLFAQLRETIKFSPKKVRSFPGLSHFLAKPEEKALLWTSLMDAFKEAKK